MTLTEKQRDAIKKVALANDRAQKAREGLFRATNVESIARDELQRVMGNMNGHKILVRLRGRPPVVVYRNGGSGEVKCDPIITA